MLRSLILLLVLSVFCSADMSNSNFNVKLKTSCGHQDEVTTRVELWAHTWSSNFDFGFQTHCHERKGCVLTGPASGNLLTDDQDWFLKVRETCTPVGSVEWTHHERCAWLYKWDPKKSGLHGDHNIELYMEDQFFILDERDEAHYPFLECNNNKGW